MRWGNWTWGIEWYRPAVGCRQWYGSWVAQRLWPLGNSEWWLDGTSSNGYRVVIRAISRLSCCKTTETGYPTPTYYNIWYWPANWGFFQTLHFSTHIYALLGFHEGQVKPPIKDLKCLSWLVMSCKADLNNLGYCWVMGCNFVMAALIEQSKGAAGLTVYLRIIV